MNLSCPRCNAHRLKKQESINALYIGNEYKDLCYINDLDELYCPECDFVFYVKKKVN
jgi:uncharacterized C2H2 Zn-finger protein